MASALAVLVFVQPAWGQSAGGATPASPVEPEPDAQALADQARQIAAEKLARFGQGYTAGIDSRRHLVYVSALDEQHSKQTAGMLAAFADGYRRLGLGGALPWNVTIILPTAEDYRKLAPRPEVTGFYTTGDRTLVSIDRGRVLLHEFTHALHHADAGAGQDHAVWVVEGLATLLEAVTVSPEGVAPQVDHRLTTLQAAIRDRKLIELERLVRMDGAAFAADAKTAYAESRYLMLYLYEQGKLSAWYQAYKSGLADDPTGKGALEKALGRQLVYAEDDWKRWAGELKLPLGESRATQARLGLELHDATEGARVVSLVSGGAAHRAGRVEVDDVIVSFNGQAVKSAAELTAMVRNTGANQTIAIELVRHGRKMTVLQPLGAPADR